MEVIESLLLSGIGRPRLAAIKESGHKVVAPHSLVEFGHDSNCFGDPAADLSIKQSQA